MIRILKASAGSGKTWNLAREYIRLLLESKEPETYRHILAVTFTNKATDEMKRRILKELHVLAEDPGSSPYFQDFVPAVVPTAEALQQRARAQLSAILHDYSAFAVSTIDRFFQQALRAFSREIGQFASYQVELDKASLVEESVDRMLDDLSQEDKALLDWLTALACEDLEQGKRFKLELPLKEMAKSLKSEDFAAAVRQLGVNEDVVFSQERLKQVRACCAKVMKGFAEQVESAAKAALEAFHRQGIDPAESYSHFFTRLYDYLSMDPNKEVVPPTEAFLRRAADPFQWFPRSKDRFRLQLEGELEAPLAAFLDLFQGKAYKVCRTAGIIRRQVYELGIAASLKKAFEALQKEKNVLCLDDSNTILKDIIDGSGTPFVYEKLGVRYEYFLLDEFQDTSLVQWDNFRPLLENSNAGGFDSLVVGDVKQSIYRWRGSDWELLDSGLRKVFSDREEKSLIKNWRTCKGIVDFNNRFFPFAASELDRLLDGSEIAGLYKDVKQVSCLDDPAEGSVDICFRDDKESQLKEIVDTIRTVCPDGLHYSDVTVLVRNNKEGSEVAGCLVAERIPVVSDDSLFVKGSVTVRRLVSQLSLVDAPAREGVALVDSYLASSMRFTVPDHYYSFTDLAETLLRGLREADPERFDTEIPYIQSFMDYLLDWSASHGNDLHAFLQEWEEAEPKIASPDSGNAVRVMTVHKSKGLEFPYVIFPFAEKVDLCKATQKWCAPAAEDTQLGPIADGVYRINLSGSSGTTLFEEDYVKERKLQFIDNLNVFYVALTRAQYGLKVIAEMPPKTIQDAVSDEHPPEWKNLSQVLYGFVKGEDYHQGSLYDFASLERKAAEAEPLRAGYPSYPSLGRSRLRFSADAADYFGPDGSVGADASNRIRGLVLHDILSAVNVPGDLPSAVDAAVASGALSRSERAHTQRFLKDEIASVEERGWFSPEARILNEAPLIGPDGKEVRPDRVILFPDGSVTIVDYKFGAEEAAHERQVGEYAALYRQMGYLGVRAFLWYIRDGEQDLVREILPRVR